LRDGVFYGITAQRLWKISPKKRGRKGSRGKEGMGGGCELAQSKIYKFVQNAMHSSFGSKNPLETAQKNDFSVQKNTSKM